MKNHSYLTIKYRDIEVSYLPELDGGGSSFGLDYLPVVREMFGKVGRAYEFCCGPAFIGFAMLAEGLCDSLCLSDINPKAVEAVRDTIRRNGLEDRVSVYLSDGLSGIPESEKWDLVVSNPPHFEVETVEEYDSNIRLNDQNWRIHKDFYGNVAKHLTDGGTILIQENHYGSEVSSFEGMVAANGMEVIDWFSYDNRRAGLVDPYFYIWIQKKGGGLSSLRRDDRPQFVFNQPDIVELSTAGPVSVELSSNQRFRLQTTNNLPSPVEIVVFKRRFGLFWRQADDPIKVAGVGPIFRLGPGQFRVMGGGRVLAKIRVS